LIAAAVSNGHDGRGTRAVPVSGRVAKPADSAIASAAMMDNTCIESSCECAPQKAARAEGCQCECLHGALAEL